MGNKLPKEQQKNEITSKNLATAPKPPPPTKSPSVGLSKSKGT